MAPRDELDLFDPNRKSSERDRHDTYARVRDSLLESYPGQEETVRALALASARQLDGEGRRIVVRGPDSPTLSALLRSQSEVMGSVFYELSAPDLAETNWSGTDIGFHVDQLVRSAASVHGPDFARQAAERACFLLRRLDGIRLEGEYASASARDHRHGQQVSLVPILAGSAVSADRSGGITWNARGALVVVSIELGGLAAGTPDVADLVSWGMVPQLAEILGSASWIHVRPPTPATTAAAVRRGILEILALFSRFGYRLSVADQVVNYVCRAVCEGPYSGGASTALAWIEAACERLLLRMIEDGAPHGEPAVLAVDDLALPSPPKGVWRE